MDQLMGSACLFNCNRIYDEGYIQTSDGWLPMGLHMIKIRQATVQDYGGLPAMEADAGQLFRAFGIPLIADMPPNPVEYYHELPKSSVVFVARTSSEEIVGFAVGLVIDGQAYLKEVSVKRAVSQQGVGRTLVANIIAWAKEKSFHYLTLTTFRDLPFNAPFYAKLGFQEFVPDHDWSELKKIREQEKKSGMDEYSRLAMRLDLTMILP